MSTENLRTVGDVASLVGVSVRTLHYWDQRGIAVPSYRSSTDYRLYTDTDVERIQLIIMYKTTGVSLDTIAHLLDDDTSLLPHLRRQRAVLTAKHNDISNMIDALEALMDKAQQNDNLSVDDIARILDDHDFPTHQAEAKQSYGDTDDWKISRQRTAAFSANDWEKVKADTDDLESRLAAACQSGMTPGSPEANALAEQHRSLLSRFYPVSYSKHVLLAAGYKADSRFHNHYDSRLSGLTDWLCDIIRANAKAHGVDPDTAKWE